MRKRDAKIKCGLSENQKNVCRDEIAVFVGKRNLIVKRKHVGILEPAEKLAVLDEKAFYLKDSGIMDISGPSITREYCVRLNSGGYAEEFFVDECDVLIG